MSTTEQTLLQNAGYVSGVGGKLFARITKRRGGVRGGAVVLNFNEQTGRIEQGTPCGTHISQVGKTTTQGEQQTVVGKMPVNPTAKVDEPTPEIDLPF